MTTKQLPPRERGLKPTHFIEAFSNGRLSISHFNNYEHYRYRNTSVNIIELLDSYIATTADTYSLMTVGIFKIYPKN